MVGICLKRDQRKERQEKAYFSVLHSWLILAAAALSSVDELELSSESGVSKFLKQRLMWKLKIDGKGAVSSFVREFICFA